jgi:alkylated DNA repair protein alkB family protein 4
MNTSRPCGCKSFRTCRVCELQLGLAPEQGDGGLGDGEVWHYAPETGRCANKEDPAKAERSFPGIQIIEDFVSSGEESELVAALDLLPWDLSQSGRRKQNFGPRANFKKRKAKVGQFAGFPAVTRFIQDRFLTVPVLESYRTVEQCSIEYRPETGASIEPHIDDCWIWGERIVQLNLLTDTVLTLNPYVVGEKQKYNLADVPTYPRTVSDKREVVFNPFLGKASRSPFPLPPGPLPDWPDSLAMVRIRLPARSLLVMWGEARYCWEHAVRRADISGRRVVIAYRELTPPYLPGGVEHGPAGAAILGQADRWWPGAGD